MKRRFLLIPLFFCAFFLSACGEKPVNTVEKTNFLMDTVVSITLYDWEDAGTIDLAFQEISRLESLLGVDQEGSELDQLAKAAGKEWVEISPETEYVLRMAKEFYNRSGGYFDVTTGPLVDLWDINGEGHYPTEEERSQALSLIDGDELLVEEGRAFLTREGMKADLGAIAKGYIADQVKTLLEEQGVEHGLLDLGRNILLIGDKPGGENFQIGIQDPNQDQGEILAVVSVSDMSVVTSGIYERFFTYEGKRYHHILDPFTGFPSDRDVASVTILCRDSVRADVLSTTCLLLGKEDGIALIESMEGVEALFISEDGATTQSSGFDTYLVSQ